MNGANLDKRCSRGLVEEQKREKGEFDMKNIHFIGAIALSAILTSCAVLTVPREGPKAYVSDELLEKEADQTWEVTDLASFNAAAAGINNAGENKKHIVTIKNSFAAKSSYSTVFYITVKKVAIVLEGDATISFSSEGSRTKSLFSVSDEQAITLKDVKLQGSNNNSYPLVMIWNGGKFIMEGSASVQGNTGRVVDNSGSCRGYTAYPGGVAVNSGIFIMRGNSSVTGNTSLGGCNGGGEGGGVAVTSYPAAATFIMQDDASVTGNTAVKGGGVYGSFIMRGNAVISGNTAEIGGGVNGRVTIEDNAKVSGNNAQIDSDIHIM